MNNLQFLDDIGLLTRSRQEQKDNTIQIDETNNQHTVNLNNGGWKDQRDTNNSHSSGESIEKVE